MALISTAALAMIMAHYPWSLEHFASAQDVNTLLAENYEGKILEARKTQCAEQAKDPKDRNTQAQQWALERVQEYAQKYRQRTGEPYRLPRCEELPKS